MKYLLAISLAFFSPLAMAAGVSIEGLLQLLIWLVVVGMLCWLCLWFIGWVGLPEPFAKIAKVVIGLVMFILLAYLLLGMLGPMPPSLR